MPTLVFAFARSGTGNTIAIVLSGTLEVAFRSSRHVSITRARLLPLVRFSEQDFLNGWEVIVFPARLTMGGIKSVRGIWHR